MKNLKIKNFGRIKEGNINFGDLTVFVGPQATGKTLVLELIKLIEDNELILKFLKENGFEWNNENEFLELYFGEGLDLIFNSKTWISCDNKSILLKKISGFNIKTNRKNSYISISIEEIGKPLFGEIEKVFYIPAQRVLTIENGWPKSFDSYASFDPYVVKKFSEDLRKFLEYNRKDFIKFIKEKNNFIYKMIKQKVLTGIFLNISKKEAKKRLVLSLKNSELPFMVWSSGQREFIPMLIGFLNIISRYKSNVKRFNGYNPSDLKEMIIIEEPEMGLHPKALETVLIMILYLIYLDYKVIISTHSADVLELIWALKNIKESNIENNRKINLLNKLFELNTKEFNKIWKKILKKNFKTYYFEPIEENVFIRDISNLDPFGDKAISEWGGLISFSTKVSDILSELPYEE